jgi:RNA polymerase sigma factor (sigma-70 family)
MNQANNDGQARRRTLLDALYRQYSRALLRFLCRQRIGSEEAAEIVQETYCRMQQVSNVEAIDFPKAYLFRTAHNLARDSHRHQRLRRIGENVSVDSVELETTEPNPFRVLNGQQELAIARQALMELSPKCRRAFVMSRFEHLTYPQIAQALGVSVSMVEKYVSQALAHLKARVATTACSTSAVHIVKQGK